MVYGEQGVFIGASSQVTGLVGANHNAPSGQGVGGLGYAIFMNGAQGGMITADNRDLNQPRDSQRAYWNDSRTWDECLRIGRLMADEALRIVKDTSVQTDPVLFCDSINVRFPVDSARMWAVIVGSP